MFNIWDLSIALGIYSLIAGSIIIAIQLIITIILRFVSYFWNEVLLKKCFNNKKLVRGNEEPEYKVWSASELNEKIKLDSINSSKSGRLKPYKRNWR